MTPPPDPLPEPKSIILYIHIYTYTYKQPSVPKFDVCVIYTLSGPLEPQDEFVRSWAGNIGVDLFDAGIVDDVGGEVGVDGCDDEFHFCDVLVK